MKEHGNARQTGGLLSGDNHIRNKTFPMQFQYENFYEYEYRLDLEIEVKEALASSSISMKIYSDRSAKLTL